MAYNYKYNSNFRKYENMFIHQTGLSFNEDELNYFIVFTEHKNYIDSAVEINNYAIFLISRYYPEFLIRLLVSLKIKKILKITNAPASIQKLYKQIARVAISSAMEQFRFLIIKDYKI